MSDTNRESPTESATTIEPTGPAGERPTPTAARVPRTRVGSTWVGICAAALILVALIAFMLQNSGRVEVTFLWLQGTLPLGLALLIAAVGAAVLTMVVGAARITQLRRLSRRRR